jgi:cytochrome P450
MGPTSIRSRHARRRDLPPAAPLPSSLQTLGCRLRPLAYLEWCRQRLGPRFTVYPLDMPPLVFLADPEDIRAVVTAPLNVLHPGAGAALTAPIFGERSFLLLDEDEYLLGRNAIKPALNRDRIHQQSNEIAALAEQEVSSWPLDTPISSHPHISVLTLKVILRRVFGEPDPLTEALHHQLLGMLEVTTSLVLQEPKLRHLPGWRHRWRQFTNHRAHADVLIVKLIARRRDTQDGQDDVLSMLLQARCRDAPMSDRELRDNLVSVIVAGHETTASTLAWAYQLIAHHPSVQDRLIDEIDERHDSGYLAATINEIIRHRPVFLFAAPRAVTHPVQISDWTYRPPAHLLACTYLMHHDPAYFPDPHTFRPERFLTGEVQARTWLPWGGGRKLCPGRHLATLELQTVLRATLSTRRLLPAQDRIDHPRWRSALLTPPAGAKIIIEQRVPNAPSHTVPGLFSSADCSTQNVSI